MAVRPQHNRHVNACKWFGNEKTASEALYLEISALPLNYIIASRIIMHLQYKLKRAEVEFIKGVYKVQKQHPTTGDFIRLVRKDIEVIGQELDEEYIFCQNPSVR